MVFVTLCVYTFTLTKNPASSSAFNCVVIFSIVTLVVVYICTLTNLSSYNSPRPIPQEMFKSDLVKDRHSVYPNTEKMIFSIPMSMKFSSMYYGTNVPEGVETVPVTAPLTSVNIQISNYCGFYWTKEKLSKRAWFVLVMWILLAIYYRYSKFWIL